jgi:cytochrome d ubiquinol oxidase subunit I
MRTVHGSSPLLSAGNILFTLLGFAGMYLLLGLLYVLLMTFEALRGPAPAVEEAPPEETEDLGLLDKSGGYGESARG